MYIDITQIDIMDTDKKKQFRRYDETAWKFYEIVQPEATDIHGSAS